MAGFQDELKDWPTADSVHPASYEDKRYLVPDFQARTLIINSTSFKRNQLKIKTVF